jgi:heme-degrading monooxygenase HmoA
MIARTPAPPYYAVIFTSIRTEGDEGYAAMAALMEELAGQQEGYLGIESAREETGITVSYWATAAAIRSWKAQVDHRAAQQLGRERWYKQYRVRICRVEQAYGWEGEGM